MTIDEQTDDFQFKLRNLVEYYHAEFDIPFHSIIGVIEEVKKEYMELGDDIIMEIEDDDDEEGWKKCHR